MPLRELRGGIAVLCLLAATLAWSATLAGCGGSDSSDATAEGSAEAGIPDAAPPLEVPESLPPKKLVVKDLSKGTGAKAKKGDPVALHYYCINWEGGVEYANSFRYGGAPTFVLGRERRLLRGLDLAVPGMREGGGREVIVPSTLVYYPDVDHPPLGPLGALICKVYLVKVHDR